MGSDADTFARFVELVASNLDEHAARGEQLAARLCVSRSQLDRVVTAASGEAPGRFRRRILLERAAYRLIAGDVGVLDVAVEAGYSSNEAFTRAFRRAMASLRPRGVRGRDLCASMLQMACISIPPVASGCRPEQR